MLKTIIVSHDPVLSKDIEYALAIAGQVAIVRRLAAYPTELELERIVRAHAPHFVVLDAGKLDQALRAAAAIQAQSPGVQIIAIDRACSHRTLLELMRAGVREFLAPPFDSQDLSWALTRIETAVSERPPAIDSTELLFAFLPSKPGVGCSITALNASSAIARKLGKKVLLADFDLNCGMIGFMMRLNGTHSMVQAAEHAADLDEQLWPKLVCSVGNLDVIPSGKPTCDFRIDPAQIRQLIEFARRNYDAICVDLSGLMEKYSLELMAEAKRIYLVSTPEIPALHLAREKLQMLREHDLEDRVRLILNRSQKHSLIPKDEIEKMVGTPIEIELPNDYRGVYEALTAGKAVDSSSELGRSFVEFARKMIYPNQAYTPPKRRFVDYFSLVPAQFSFLPDRKKPAT